MMEEAHNLAYKEETHTLAYKEEPHTLTYKKLVVPMSMRSIYWKYFGFPATDEGDILTKVKIVCVLCKTQIAYNRNTSNLRMHLQNKHPQELLELEANAPPRRPSLDPKEKRLQKRLKKPFEGPGHIYTTSADGTVQIEGDIQFITAPTVSIGNLTQEGANNQNLRVVLKGNSQIPEQNVAIILPQDNANNQHQGIVDGKTVSDAIAEFVILDLQLPDVVEGRGFQRLIATLRSPCEIPSKTKLEEELIPKIYESFKETIQSNLSLVSNEIGISVEEWTSANDQVFITISVHYQSTEPVLETKVLSTIHCSENMDYTQWSLVFDGLFHEWDVKIDRVTAVVTATLRQEIIDALSSKGLLIVPCMIHCLQECADACFKIPAVQSVIRKCRIVASAILQNSNVHTALKIQEQMHQLEDTKLVTDYPKVWTSTCAMLERFLEREKIIGCVVDSVQGVTKESLTFTDEDWSIIRDLNVVLEPFKVTTMTLSEEKVPLISLLKPLLWQLISAHLKVRDTDSKIAKTLKELMAEHLCEKYSDTTVNLLLQIATTLDPRFKLLPYATEDDKAVIANHMKKMLIACIIDEGKQSSNDTKDKNFEGSPSKKSRLSGMEFLLGSLCVAQNGMPAEERADLELIQYQSESAAALDYCPLQWWSKTAAKCPNLAKLARKYCCVPASAMPAHRILPENQILFDIRRASLNPDLVDKMLFLHGNHNA